MANAASRAAAQWVNEALHSSKLEVSASDRSSKGNNRAV
eukprot:CAMPEP_0204260526 /NCGR_PEP_ID=MMETSP0468-20130131/6404_1 /ASSEMBLY_ACC=CAM_ASM_000383 /TAXON_ID=2969 /ORGANISM="Oxyrrhis marina" /LENGTH=38 /DNA_ID= /DNA_START= /DNA_END= /DNA_ORIENTATION=